MNRSGTLKQYGLNKSTSALKDLKKDSFHELFSSGAHQGLSRKGSGYGSRQNVSSGLF